MGTQSADARLLRGAGIAAIAGGVLLVLTAILLFVGATGMTDTFPWANDVVVAVAMLMLIPAIVATRRLGWPRVLGVPFDVLAVGDRLMVTRMRFRAGMRAATHVHPHEQAGYVISGLSGKPFPAPATSFTPATAMPSRVALSMRWRCSRAARSSTSSLRRDEFR